MGYRAKKTFSIEEYWMAEKHLRKCSTSLAIREMQIKTTLRFHLTPIRLAKTKTEMTADVARLRRKRNTSPLLVGLSTDTTTLEISLAIPQKIGHSTTWRPSNSTSGHIPKRPSNVQQRHMHHNVHSSPIYNSQNLERTQMFFSRWMDTKIVVYLHNGVLLIFQKQWLYKILQKIDAYWEYHPECGNPVTKEQI